MNGIVSVVAYLMLSFSICVRKKTAETLFGPVTPREPFIRPRLCWPLDLTVILYLFCLEERAAAVPIRCTKAWLRFKGSHQYCIQPFED